MCYKEPWRKRSLVPIYYFVDEWFCWMNGCLCMCVWCVYIYTYFCVNVYMFVCDEQFYVYVCVYAYSVVLHMHSHRTLSRLYRPISTRLLHMFSNVAILFPETTKKSRRQSKKPVPLNTHLILLHNLFWRRRNFIFIYFYCVIM